MGDPWLTLVRDPYAGWGGGEGGGAGRPLPIPIAVIFSIDGLNRTYLKKKIRVQIKACKG